MNDGKIKIKYNSEDYDVNGNFFPSIVVNQKKFFHQDLPIICGINNETEFMGFNDSLNKAKNFVTDINFMQNWLMFSEDYIYLWIEKIPSEINIDKPDIEIPIESILDKELSIPAIV